MFSLCVLYTINLYTVIPIQSAHSDVESGNICSTNACTVCVCMFVCVCVCERERECVCTLAPSSRMAVSCVQVHRSSDQLIHMLNQITHRHGKNQRSLGTCQRILLKSFQQPVFRCVCVCVCVCV